MGIENQTFPEDPHNTLGSDPIYPSVPDIRPEDRWDENKFNHQLPAQGVLVPYALMDTLMREHGVCYEQGMTSTEVQ